MEDLEKYITKVVHSNFKEMKCKDANMHKCEMER